MLRDFLVAGVTCVDLLEFSSVFINWFLNIVFFKASILTVQGPKLKMV